jgi:hypothetical protein
MSSVVYMSRFGRVFVAVDVLAALAWSQVQPCKVILQNGHTLCVMGSQQRFSALCNAAHCIAIIRFVR